MVKWVVRSLAVLVLLLVAAAVVLWLYIDHVAARALTGGIEYAGEVPCDVESVDVSVFSGRIRIDTLSVGNPRGHDPGQMFLIRQGEVETSIAGLRSSPKHFRRLEIRGAVVNIEGGEGGTNVSVFIDTVREKIGRKEHQLRLAVDKLVIRDATVCIGRGLGGDSFVTIKLDYFEVDDVHGDDGRGVAVGELVAGIVRELVRRGAVQANLNLRNLLPGEVVRGLEVLTLPAATVLKGATDLLTAPLTTLLRPRTRPAPP